MLTVLIRFMYGIRTLEVWRDYEDGIIPHANRTECEYVLGITEPRYPMPTIPIKVAWEPGHRDGDYHLYIKETHTGYGWYSVWYVFHGWLVNKRKGSRRCWTRMI